MVKIEIMLPQSFQHLKLIRIHLATNEILIQHNRHTANSATKLCIAS